MMLLLLKVLHCGNLWLEYKIKMLVAPIRVLTHRLHMLNAVTYSPINLSGICLAPLSAKSSSNIFLNPSEAEVCLQGDFQKLFYIYNCRTTFKNPPLYPSNYSLACWLGCRAAVNFVLTNKLGQ